MLRRLGFVSALLLTLASAMPAASAQACAPGPDTVSVVAASDSGTDTCSTDDCQDCGLACSHSCCHAPHVGVMVDAAAPLTADTFRSPGLWADAVGGPLGAPSGLERPPRA